MFPFASKCQLEPGSLLGMGASACLPLSALRFESLQVRSMYKKKKSTLKFEKCCFSDAMWMAKVLARDDLFFQADGKQEFYLLYLSSVS